MDSTDLLAQPFSSILNRDIIEDADEADISAMKSPPAVSLLDCVVSSSHGEHRLFRIRCIDEAGSSSKILDRKIRVSPIVERKSTESEVTDVAHFALEILQENHETDASASASEDGSLTDDTENNGYAIGVMG